MISPSLLSADFTNLEKEIKILNEEQVDFLHLDIMDGKFVENKNYDIKDISLFLRENVKPLDVHLMCCDLEKYIVEYADLMPEFITFHLEATDKVNEMIDMIHSYGIKCGISIKPYTSVKELLPYLDKIELVLIMSVEPGKGGQKFMPIAIDKTNEIRKLNKNIIISVDGGINDETIRMVNTDMVVSGSYVCMSDNFEKNIEILKK